MHDSLGIHYCLDILNYLNEHNYLRGPDNYICFYCDLQYVTRTKCVSNEIGMRAHNDLRMH
jgi:hypothetical protein